MLRQSSRCVRRHWSPPVTGVGCSHTMSSWARVRWLLLVLLPLLLGCSRSTTLHFPDGSQLRGELVQVEGDPALNVDVGDEVLRVDPASVADYELPGTALRRVGCLLYTSPSPRDRSLSRMPSSA